MSALTPALPRSARERTTRRVFLQGAARLCGLAVALDAMAACTQAPPPAPRSYRLGWLNSAPEAGEQAGQNAEYLLQRLGELGYVESQNLTLDRRSIRVSATADENLALAGELVRLGPDIIIAGSPAALAAAMAAAPSTPIIVGPILAADGLLNRGEIESLARPGGNVTGVAGAPTEVDLKRLQLLKEALPDTRTVAVLGNFGETAFWEPAKAALGIELFNVTPAEGFEMAVARAAEQGADALLLRGAGTAGNAFLVAELVGRYRLPAVLTSRAAVEAGGLMAYVPRLRDSVRRMADYVDRILRGAKPADLPVEMPTRYDLIVNMRTARALGLTLPQSFMAQVDEVIE